jgi:hypothetical protein
MEVVDELWGEAIADSGLDGSKLQRFGAVRSAWEGASAQWWGYFRPPRRERRGLPSRGCLRGSDAIAYGGLVVEIAVPCFPGERAGDRFLALGNPLEAGGEGIGFLETGRVALLLLPTPRRRRSSPPPVLAGAERPTKPTVPPESGYP